jgi:hypothetical protein
MVVRRIAFALLAVMVLSAVSPDTAKAQRPKGNAIEVATMAGITVLRSKFGGNATEIGIPSGSSAEVLLPSLRLTFWSPGAVALDAAISFAHISSDGSNGTLSLFEAGPSFSLPSGGSTIATLGGVFGVLSASGGGSSSDFYLGPQFIVRNRLRDYAVGRFQAGVRMFTGDDFGLDYSIEIAGGVGFFL